MMDDGWQRIKWHVSILRIYEKESLKITAVSFVKSAKRVKVNAYDSRINLGKCLVKILKH